MTHIVLLAPHTPPLFSSPQPTTVPQMPVTAQSGTAEGGRGSHSAAMVLFLALYYVFDVKKTLDYLSKQDLSGTIEKIAKFLDKDLPKKVVERIAGQTTFEAMRADNTVNYSWFSGLLTGDFLRKGITVINLDMCMLLIICPFTPKFKKYILPTLLKRNV